MAKRQWLSPSAKRKRFSDQLNKGYVEETGEFLSAEQAAYRKGYNQAVFEGQSLYRYKNASDEERANYKAERKAKRRAWRASKKADQGE